MASLTRILLSQQKSSSSYYITTPIFYVNAVPHIGHLYTTLLADASARWKRLKSVNGGADVLMATGTDEHGIKIQKKAVAEKKEPLKLCDEISGKFRLLFDKCDVKYDDYIRTTEERHRIAVYEIWNKLMSNGFIYKSSYEGWYSVNDECFLAENEVELRRDANGNQIRVSIESGHQVEITKESNYMFKLGHFKQELRNYLNTNIITPKKYAEALHAQLDGLEDLSVSREASRIYWGLPVPNDSSQIIYVWLDALVNYLTVVGYPNDREKFAKYWPANVHVVGKDILRFHAIYWPAFLMAAGLELPKKIVCHGHWLVENKKMSKSIGNVIDPFDCVNKFSKDGIRYFLLREGVPDSDCSINVATFAKYINAELSNTLGNLYQRMLPFNADEHVYPSFESVAADLTDNDKEFLRNLNELREKCDQDFEAFNFYLGIQKIMAALRDANSLFQFYEPWKLVKQQSDANNRRKMRKVLFLIYESLRISGILMQPIVPDLAANLLRRLNVNVNERNYSNAVLNESGKSSSIEKRSPGSSSDVLFKRIM